MLRCYACAGPTGAGLANKSHKGAFVVAVMIIVIVVLGGVIVLDVAVIIVILVTVVIALYCSPGY